MSWFEFWVSWERFNFCTQGRFFLFFGGAAFAGATVPGCQRPTTSCARKGLRHRAAEKQKERS
jgi:hypothetical protein